MVFLELQRDSRVTTGIQDASCVGPGKSNLPFELRRKAGVRESNGTYPDKAPKRKKKKKKVL